MSHDTSGSVREWLTDPVGAIPVDLVLLTMFVAVVDFALAQPNVYGTPLAVVLGVPLVLFAPGYAIVAVLFPGAGPENEPSGWVRATVRSNRAGLTVGERLAVSFGTSLALLPPLGVALSLADVGFTPWTVLTSLSAITVGGVAVGAVRRVHLAPSDRFGIPVRALWRRLRAGVVGTDTAMDAALNVALALAVLAAVASLGYAVAVPSDGEEFSNLSLVTENESGEYVTSGYPQNFSAGETKPLTVAVENHEERTVEYTVVVKLQRVEQASNDAARVLRETELTRLNQRVAAGETWRTRHDIAPTMIGEDQRLVYLLYTGDPPRNPTTSNADEHAHIWINVRGIETDG